MDENDENTDTITIPDEIRKADLVVDGLGRSWRVSRDGQECMMTDGPLILPLETLNGLYPPLSGFIKISSPEQ